MAACLEIYDFLILRIKFLLHVVGFGILPAKRDSVQTSEQFLVFILSGFAEHGFDGFSQGFCVGFVGELDRIGADDIFDGSELRASGGIFRDFEDL